MDKNIGKQEKENLLSVICKSTFFKTKLLEILLGVQEETIATKTKKELSLILQEPELDATMLLTKILPYSQKIFDVIDHNFSAEEKECLDRRSTMYVLENEGIEKKILDFFLERFSFFTNILPAEVAPSDSSSEKQFLLLEDIRKIDTYSTLLLAFLDEFQNLFTTNLDIFLEKKGYLSKTEKNRGTHKKISHELRTPLHQIMGFCELASESEVESGSIPIAYQKIIEEAMQRLHDRILGLENTLTTYESFPVSKNGGIMGTEKIKKIIAQWQGEYTKKGMKITYTEPGNNRISISDETIPLFNQLIDNAGKYGRGEVTVSLFFTEKEKNSVILEVKDKGTGIPQLYQDYIFRENTKDITAPREKNPSRGLGCGREIIQNITQKVGAKIDIDSGETGTTVHVEIPTLKESTSLN